MNELISKEMLALNIEMHQSKMAYGQGGGAHREAIIELVNNLKTAGNPSPTVLDYGCGQGYLQKSLPFPISQYDPAIPEFSSLSESCDLVCCSDVLEHIEPAKIDAVLNDLKRATRSVGYFVIHTGLAYKRFSNGMNTHLLVQDTEAWLSLLSRFFVITKHWVDGIKLFVLVKPLKGAELITDRIDQITEISNERLGEILAAPKSVKIELTQRCNYRCTFCALTMREAPPLDFDMNLFRRITREMRDAGVEDVGVFYIGESFTVLKRLVEAITYLKKELAMPYVFLTTNGSLAHPAAVAQVMKAGLDSLKWSITSCNPAEFSQIVGVKPELFHQSLDNLRAAWELRNEFGYKTKLYASSIKYDDAQQAKMEPMISEWVRPFVDQHYWLPLYSFADATGVKTQEMGYKPTPGNRGRIGALRDPLPCWCVFTEGHVTAEGMLSACGFDALGRFSMADLHNMSFMQGWNSLDFQELRRAHLKKDVSGTECQDCVLYTG